MHRQLSGRVPIPEDQGSFRDPP